MIKNKKLTLIVSILLLIGFSFNFNVVNVSATAGEYPYFGEYNWDFSNASEYTLDDGLEISDGEARLEFLNITPYGYWQLNETSGTNAPDSSGNGRDGTLTSMTDADWISGKINNSLTFDGTGDYVISTQYRNGGAESEVLSGSITYSGGGNGGDGGNGGGGGDDDVIDGTEGIVINNMVIFVIVLTVISIVVILYFGRNMLYKRNPISKRRVVRKKQS